MYKTPRHTAHVMMPKTLKHDHCILRILSQFMPDPNKLESYEMLSEKYYAKYEKYLHDIDNRNPSTQGSPVVLGANADTAKRHHLGRS